MIYFTLDTILCITSQQLVGRINSTYDINYTILYSLLYYTILYIDPEARPRRQLCVRVACAVRVLGRGQRGKSSNV